MRAFIPLAVAFTLPAAALAQALRPDPPVDCYDCAEWNAPRPPAPIFGGTYYVGPDGLTSVLITSDAGHILIDGGLPQSAEVIAGNIRALGFNPLDVKVILASHAHFDHVGGIAALARYTGAEVRMSEAGAEALRRGIAPKDDPQRGFGRRESRFPRVRGARGVADGEVVTVGPLAVTAHLTPGHTPGGTSWTWRACEGERCLDVAYVDSLTPVSAPGFSFLHTTGRAGEEAFRATLDVVEGLPCDILLTTHPGASDLDDRLARKAAGEQPDPLIDPGACRALADRASRALDERLAEEARGE